MRKRIIKKIIVVIIIIIGVYSLAYASANEGTNTYKDYIFILVHGLNENTGFFTGGTQFGNLKAYLENNLGLRGRVFCYNFSNTSGDNFINARELGDRGYYNRTHLKIVLGHGSIWKGNVGLIRLLEPRTCAR